MDWAWIKEMAFGALNLSHDIFWKLTPAEFLELFEGWQRRQKQSHELRMREYSVLASWLTAVHVKKPLKPTDFYDPEKLNQLSNQQEQQKLETPEEKKKMLADLEKQLGVKS